MRNNNKPLVVIIGNPNSGKTTLFNKLTGMNRKTGNWSGVTVDSQYCSVNYGELNYSLVDLPGIFGLSLESQGQDEAHVLEFLQTNKPDLIVNVINASCIEKGLFLTLEILEQKIPVVSVLNMCDEAEAKNLKIDFQKMQEILGVKVVSMIATEKVGLGKLQTQINEVLNKADNHTEKYFSMRKEKEKESPTLLSEEEIFSLRLKEAKNISKQIVYDKDIREKDKGSRLDYLTTHPFWGLLTFVLAMYIMFFFAINVSSVFIDFFDLASGALFVDGSALLFGSLGLPDWFIGIVSEGIGGGIQTVATFVPVIGFLYLALAWLEDSGYMARAAFVMNGYMRNLGLSGQTFVPLIISFGCNVPAIAATRALSSKRERLITIMMAPFMSCSARLSVYALLVSAFFSKSGSIIVLALYLSGIIVAILTGIMLQKTVLKGEPEPFLIELPTWRRPKTGNLLAGTWLRLKGFLISAGKIIVLMAAILQILNSVGRDLSWDNSNSENSVLSATAKLIVPVFEPMGIEEKNWPAVVGIMTGILAKEVVVGTLDSLYDDMHGDDGEPSGLEGMKNTLLQAIESVKTNAISLGDQLLDPLGISILTQESEQKMAEAQGVDKKIFGILRDKFSDRYAVFAYLLFILLYVPCVATIAAIAKEAGSRWAVLAGVWSTSLAYLTATNFYQWSRFNSQPLAASIWMAVFVAVVYAFYKYLKKNANVLDPLRLNIS